PPCAGGSCALTVASHEFHCRFLLRHHQACKPTARQQNRRQRLLGTARNMTNSKETWKRKIMPCPPPTRWNQRAAPACRALVNLLILLQKTSPQLISLPLAAPVCPD